MTQRDYALPYDYDDVPVDNKVSDPESVDPYESCNAVLLVDTGTVNTIVTC